MAFGVGLSRSRLHFGAPVATGGVLSFLPVGMGDLVWTPVLLFSPLLACGSPLFLFFKELQLSRSSIVFCDLELFFLLWRGPIFVIISLLDVGTSSLHLDEVWWSSSGQFVLAPFYSSPIFGVLYSSLSCFVLVLACVTFARKTHIYTLLPLLRLEK